MRRLALFIGSLIIWCVLTWPPNNIETIVGVIIALIVAFVFPDVFSIKVKQYLSPKRIFYVILYIPVFIYYCLLANLDVAYRVLHPKMPINPGIVKAKTTLTTDVAKAFLANSITLTPGTMTIDIIDDNIYIHWINVTATDEQEVTKKLVSKFEYFIKRIFE